MSGPPDNFIGSGSAMGRMIAGFDWSATPLGPIATWPPPLKLAIDVILRAPLPMAIMWGRDGILIYNDGIARFAGARHPDGLGRPVLQGWPEMAELNRQVLAAGLAGRTTALREELLTLQRNGHAEDVWADLDFSPIPDADGNAAGVLAVIREITERVLSDWRRREAENQLALAMDATQLGTWNVDLRTRALNWSVHCKLAFGMAVDAPATMDDFRNCLHPADLGTVLEAFTCMLDPALRTVCDVEFRTIGAQDQLVRWVAARGKAVFDEQGKAVRAIGTTLDITARKNAELRQNYLIELGDRFRALETTAEIAAAASEILGRALGGSRAGYAMVHGDHMIVECDWTDGQILSIAGPRPLTALGERFCAPLRAGRTLVVNNVANDFVTAENRDVFAALGVGALMKAPLIANGELAAILYIHQTTPRHWTAEEIALLKDIADRTWEASSRANAVQALRTLNESLEHQVAYRTAQRDRMWRLSSDVMMVASLDAVIESVNPAWKAVFGWNETDMVGRNFVSLTHPEDRPATRAEVYRLAAGQPTTHFENRYRRRDGSYLWLSWRAVPDASSIHAVGRDITAEREQAEALHAAEEALRQSQKMEAVGQLTGGIAHDFNNLLQGIAGALDLLDKRIAQGRTEELEKFISAARLSANRAAALTHRLLAFSRRQPLDPKPVQANPLVASMEDLLRRTMGELIDISPILADDLWLTLCDPNQLESAILNLAINARDAMPDGGRLILETCNTQLDAAYTARMPDARRGDYICLSVTDTGTGMPQSVIDQAFEPFFTTKPTGQGTGLGLSMVYGFTKQSGGHIKIYSEVGRGTTVKIYLPRYDGDAADDDTTAAAETATRAATGETVLVVEDETVVRDLVVQVLEELGYQVMDAADGPAGLKILQSAQPLDLLITDIGLPGLNGRQIADAARLLRPRLKILFMTGYAENAAMAGGFLEPGMAMITKPFPIEVLENRVRKMIEG